MRLRDSKPPITAFRVIVAAGIALALQAGAGCCAPNGASAGRQRVEPWRTNAALVAVRGVIWNETITTAQPIRISLLVRNISKGEVYALKQFNSRNYSFVGANLSSSVHGDAEGAYADEHFVRLKPGETMVFWTDFWITEERGEGKFRVRFHNNMLGEFQTAPQRDGIPVVNDLEYDFGTITIAARNATTNRLRASEHDMTEPWRANMALVAIRGVIWNEKIRNGEAIDVSLVVRNTSKGEVYALKQFNCHNCFLKPANSGGIRVHGDGELAVFDRDFVRLKPREEMVYSSLFYPSAPVGEADFRVNLHDNQMFEQAIAPKHDGIPVVNHLDYDFGKIVIHPASESSERPSSSGETAKDGKSGGLSASAALTGETNYFTGGVYRLQQDVVMCSQTNLVLRLLGDPKGISRELILTSGTLLKVVVLKPALASSIDKRTAVYVEVVSGEVCGWILNVTPISKHDPRTGQAMPDPEFLRRIR